MILIESNILTNTKNLKVTDDVKKGFRGVTFRDAYKEYCEGEDIITLRKGGNFSDKSDAFSISKVLLDVRNKRLVYVGYDNRCVGHGNLQGTFSILYFKRPGLSDPIINLIGINEKITKKTIIRDSSISEFKVEDEMLFYSEVAKLSESKNIFLVSNESSKSTSRIEHSIFYLNEKSYPQKIALIIAISEYNNADEFIRGYICIEGIDAREGWGNRGIKKYRNSWSCSFMEILNLLQLGSHEPTSSLLKDFS